MGALNGAARRGDGFQDGDGIHATESRVQDHKLQTVFLPVYKLC
jgi:hypothetical protein